jgi:YfiH family protein
VFYKDSRQIYRVTELDSLPWLAHGFGTRRAHVSALFGNLATLRQIHSAVCVPAAGRCGVLGEGDALLENTPGSVVAIRTADCLPILLVDDRHRAVAAVHAGWRGTVAGIAQRAVEAMCAQFGSLAGDLHAAIGPGIGQCCYEVGPEVAAQFGRQGAEACEAAGESTVGPEVAAQFGRQGRAHVDLGEANRRQLMDAGVTPERIYASNLCTMCRSEEFHSFRRDKEAAGRLYSFAGILQAVH